MKKTLEPSNVVEALILTHYYDLPDLFYACILVLKLDETCVETLDGWQKLKDLGSVDEILEALASEDGVSVEPDEDIELLFSD